MTEENSPQQKSLPWYESGLFWGCVSLAAAIFLTVIAAMQKDLRWLLIFVWPLVAIAAGVVYWKRKSLVLLICLPIVLSFVGIGLWELNSFLKPEITNSQQSQGSEKESSSPSTPAIKPSYLSAQCSLPKDFSPCEIKCSVYNPHDTAMPNVSVGFNGVYPYQTRLAAGTETHMSIKKQDTLPLPMSGGYLDQNLLAFSVEIPSIPPRTALSFTIWSLSDDNQKACTYLKTTIRSEQRKKIDQLVSMKKNLDADRMVALQAKRTSLFVPGYFMSSEGRRKVEFVTSQEERTAKEFSDLYEKFVKTIVGRRCIIPVFAAERSDGSPQYFANGPPMMTWIFNKESWKVTELPGGGSKMETDPHPPASYTCESN